MADNEVVRITVTAPDGRDLRVLVAGDTLAMPVVIRMGTPAGLLPLPSQMDLMRAGVRPVLYARPDYGGSTAQPGRSVADAAADTAAILDALEADTFVTLGWSAGGPDALACAALLPERCLATAVVAGVAPYPSEVWADDALPLTRQGVDVLSAALEERRAESSGASRGHACDVFPRARSGLPERGVRGMASRGVPGRVLGWHRRCSR